MGVLSEYHVKIMEKKQVKYENPFKQRGLWLSDEQHNYLLEIAISNNHMSRSRALRDLLDEHKRKNKNSTTKQED
jgi:hypothetical protein